MVLPCCHSSPLPATRDATTGTASTMHAFVGGGGAVGSGGCVEVSDARVESLRLLRTASRRHDFHERQVSERICNMEMKSWELIHQSILFTAQLEVPPATVARYTFWIKSCSTAVTRRPRPPRMPNTNTLAIFGVHKACSPSCSIQPRSGFWF